jgi:hypothetical protein
LNALKASASLRIGLLLVLLVGEVAWFALLRTFGWNSTNAKFVWALCLIGALLPLIVAAVALGRQRMRFTSRAMLVATALVAAFLFFTIRPLQTAWTSRRASQALMAARATLSTESSWDGVYRQLAYDPRTASTAQSSQQLAPWLRPLAGDLVKIPPADSVREIWLGSDAQIEALCNEAASFPNLERLGIGGGTPAAMEKLRQVIPKFARLSELLLDVDLPYGWFRSLPRIHTLSLWAEGRPAGTKIPTEQLRDIAALPDLRVLDIFLYAETDADVKVLSTSKSLRRLILKKTAVTAAGPKQLSAAMPECVVYGN